MKTNTQKQPRSFDNISCGKYLKAMKEIYFKEDFPEALGGNRYEWKDAETTFNVPENGQYVIAVTASAKNAGQNNSNDDDDLRAELDGYAFGLIEIHEEKISWKGFGTASSWDGASLKSGTKTVYLFAELSSGEHTLKFYADGTPAMKEIRVSQMKKGESFDAIRGLKPTENIDTDKKGIPWMSLVFLGVKPKNFELSVICNAATKEKSDGDNVKVVTNGGIVQNEKAPTSDKYKNFYFSGDLDRGKKKTLTLSPNTFLQVENSVELWYDQAPELCQISFSLFKNHDEYVKDLVKLDIKEMIRNILRFVAHSSKIFRPNLEIARLFLLHSIKDNPSNLDFDDGDLIAKKIRSDNAYGSIKEMVAERISIGETVGTIEVGSRIAFETGDLLASIHGLKTVDFSATKTSENEFGVEMVLMDIYDFDFQNYSDAYTEYDTHKLISIGEKIVFTVLNNLADVGEYFGAVSNFESRVKIKDSITIK